MSIIISLVGCSKGSENIDKKSDYKGDNLELLIINNINNANDVINKSMEELNSLKVSTPDSGNDISNIPIVDKETKVNAPQRLPDSTIFAYKQEFLSPNPEKNEFDFLDRIWFLMPFFNEESRLTSFVLINDIDYEQKTDEQIFNETKRIVTDIVKEYGTPLYQENLTFANVNDLDRNPIIRIFESDRVYLFVSIENNKENKLITTSMAYFDKLSPHKNNSDYSQMLRFVESCVTRTGKSFNIIYELNHPLGGSLYIDNSQHISEEDKQHLSTLLTPIEDPEIIEPESMEFEDYEEE